MKESYNYLLNKVLSTRNARLEAYRRNQKLQSLSTYGVAGISAWTIFLSFYIAVSKDQQTNLLLGLVGALASLFILVLSLIDGSKEYSLKAYLFHKCALDLSPLCIQLQKQINKQEFDEIRFDEIEKCYEEILNSYQLNHSQLDYDLYIVKYPEHLQSDSYLKIQILRSLYKFFIDVKVYFIYYFIISLLLIATVFLFYRMVIT